MIAALCNARRRAADDDTGFALIFVLVVTTVIVAAVGTTLSVVAPNILSGKRSQDAAAATAAAQAGVDDVVAYLSSIPACRSETRVCPQALGASSASLLGTTYRRPTLGTGQTFSWTTSSNLTSDGYVRVTSTGTSSGTSRKLVADISLQPSILQFGYYSDYETQSPSVLNALFPSRAITVNDATTMTDIDAYNTSGRQLSISSPTTINWQGSPASGTNPYPSSICGYHWYSQGSTPGRYSYGTNTLWGERGTIGSSTVIRTSTCDVVWTTGMTEDGPIYSRDALLISDGTSGGAGPIFKQPVYSLWGFPGYTTPVPPSQPWRQDTQVGGRISAGSAYSPAIATADLSLPSTVGEDGLPANACVYYGPTRVVLNGNGTATVTSPFTTSRNSASDSGCYPTGSLAGGIANFTLDYVGNGAGAIFVKNSNTPASGWPVNPTKSTQTPSTSNEIFWLPATTGGAAQPDQANSSAASATCTSSAKYSAQAAWPCAWSNLYSATDGNPTLGTPVGWTGYAATTCSLAALTPVNRELFECEYGQKSGSTTLAVNQSGGNYAALRSVIQTDLAKGTCLSGTTSAQTTCLTNLVNADLKPANTGQHAANYATPANGDHQYVVTAASAGSASTGASQTVGSAPTNPMAGDSLFTYSGTAAKEAPSQTPITLSVSRQTYSALTGWGSTTPQFTVTVTQNQWSITQQASGAAYFPNPLDVTGYNTGAAAGGLAAGSTGTAQPGDLYVQGVNHGKLSLIAQDNVELTGNLTDASTDTSVDAIDLTAENNVRNYHPVQCTDQTAADINATSTGWCPNDITGLYRGVLENNGVLYAQHPARQYADLLPTADRTIDAAVFALSGSFGTDNYNRGGTGAGIGNLYVNGGVYQSHRGANGSLWEFRSSDTTRARSGYSLNYHYVDLEHADLPYAPPVTSGNNQRVWNVVSVSASS